MAFFTNDAVNRLNLHFAINALALAGGGAFYGAFLLRAGAPIPAVLASLAMVNLGRFALRPFVLGPARRWGLKPLVVAGTLLCSLQYPILAGVHGVGWRLLALIVVSAVGDTLYWTAYHAYYASLGDAEHRGGQVGLRQALAAGVGIVAPLATGWVLATYGPDVAFGATALVVVVAALPILGAPNVRIAASASSALGPAWRGVRIFAADGWEYGAFAIWQIALFVSVGESFTGYGLAVSLAALAGAVAGLLLGRVIDLGHGRRAAWAVGALLVAADVVRIAGFGAPARALFANAAGALASAISGPPMMAAVYNMGKEAPCPMRYQIAADGGWDAGAGCACVLGAGLIWLGAPIQLAIALSLPGSIALFLLLRRHYGAVAMPEPGAAVG